MAERDPDNNSLACNGLDCQDQWNVWIGNYDWKFLCMPTWPWCLKEKRPSPPFYPKDDWLSLMLTAIMGLQHALAMVGGIITPPLLVGSMSGDVKITQYLISASLICIRLTIPFTGGKYFYGTGLISVIGTSFTFLPITQNTITILMNQGESFNTAYGKILGVAATCCIVTIVLSFMPPRVLKRVFPPMVTGVTIFLIGANLVGTGILYWGGGVFCGQNTGGLPPEPLGPCYVFNSTTGQNISQVDSSGQPITCYAPAFVPSCTDNGQVIKPFGTGIYIGMGATVFGMLVFIELFGSPFMRNTEVIIALLFGYFCAAVTKVDGDKLIVLDNIHSAKSITFLWTTTFPLGFYAPAVLPFLVGYVVTTVEGIGDITATEEASLLQTTGLAHAQRIQGGLLGDGFNSLFAALGTTLPNTTFAQNNGVIALTKCAARSAGISAGIWLFVMGVLAKIGGWVTTIPDCVLGGMTTFLFANVCVSGLKVISTGGYARRTRFILAVSLGLGLGVSLVPAWATNNLWNVTDSTSGGVRGIRNAIILVLQTGFCLGCLTAIFLHLILPEDANDCYDQPINVPSPTDESTYWHHGKKKEEESDDSLDNPKELEMTRDAAAKV